MIGEGWLKSHPSFCFVRVQEGDLRKTMAARGLVNGEGPTKWEGFSFPQVSLLNSQYENVSVSCIS